MAMTLEQLAEKVLQVPGVIYAKAWEKHGKQRVYFDMEKGRKCYLDIQENDTHYKPARLSTDSDLAIRALMEEFIASNLGAEVAEVAEGKVEVTVEFTDEEAARSVQRLTDAYYGVSIHVCETYLLTDSDSHYRETDLSRVADLVRSGATKRIAVRSFIPEYGVSRLLAIHVEDIIADILKNRVVYTVSDSAGHTAEITAADDSLTALVSAIDCHYQAEFRWRDTVKEVVTTVTKDGITRDVRIAADGEWEVFPIHPANDEPKFDIEVLRRDGVSYGGSSVRFEHGEWMLRVRGAHAAWAVRRDGGWRICEPSSSDGFDQADVRYDGLTEDDAVAVLIAIGGLALAA